MEFTNEFTVPTDVDTAFATLTDLERVAPCLPGATLEEVDGDVYRGRVKVKAGPVTIHLPGDRQLWSKRTPTGRWPASMLAARRFEARERRGPT
jgi:uncharacterized protein